MQITAHGSPANSHAEPIKNEQALPQRPSRALPRPSELGTAPPRDRLASGKAVRNLAPRQRIARPDVPNDAAETNSCLPMLAHWLISRLRPLYPPSPAPEKPQAAGKPTQAIAATAAKPDPAPVHLPSRLQAKVDRADALGTTRDVTLNTYADAASTLLRSNLQSTAELTHMDIAHLPLLVETENARHPGLHLRAFKNAHAFVDATSDPSAAHFCALVPMQFQDSSTPSSLHHVMADVKIEPGKPPSIIFLESAIFDPVQLEQHQKVWEMLKDRGLDLGRVGVIELNVQASRQDCVMFSLSFALKAHAHRPQIDGMHQNLREGWQLTPEVDLKQSLRRSRGVLHQFWMETDIADRLLQGVRFAAGPVCWQPISTSTHTPVASRRPLTREKPLRSRSAARWCNASKISG